MLLNVALLRLRVFLLSVAANIANLAPLHVMF
jgi:hypothetical protein